MTESQNTDFGGRIHNADWANLLDWRCNEDGDTPLYQQVADFLRDRIVTGIIPSGSRLPSTRQLMDRLGVSRTTVITAYSQLHAEGYVVGRVGSGTYVAKDPMAPLAVCGADGAEAVQAPARPDSLGLSARGARYHDVDLDHLVPDNVPFNTGMTRTDGRTTAQWQHILRRHLAIESAYQGYSAPQGSLEIRREIARYVGVSRHIRCTPDEVILVSGSQQAIDLAIKVLLGSATDAVWVEEPGYPPTRMALQAAGIPLHSIPVDGDGVRVFEGIARCPQASAAFVTPSHQYPLGVSLSMHRRAALLDWAARRNAWVIEDDYDSEFRYNGPALPALKGLDSAGRVIYIGTFSKVLLPGLRYGYMVVPAALAKAFAVARFLADRHSPLFLERVLAEFMQRGHFVSHIRRMRAEYAQARDTLVGLLRTHVGEYLDVEVPNQGLHLIAHLRHGLSDTLVAEQARRTGVVVRPLSRLYAGAPDRSGLMLGFSGFTDSRMRTAVQRLAAVLKARG